MNVSVYIIMLNVYSDHWNMQRAYLKKRLNFNFLFLSVEKGWLDVWFAAPYVHIIIISTTNPMQVLKPEMYFDIKSNSGMQTCNFLRNVENPFAIHLNVLNPRKDISNINLRLKVLGQFLSCKKKNWNEHSTNLN